MLSAFNVYMYIFSDYIKPLMACVFQRLASGKKYLSDISKPPPLTSSANKVTKSEAIKQHKTRFAKNTE